MTVKELLKKFKVGSKWKCVTSCVGRSAFGMKSGDSYSSDLVVFKVKRVRAEWEQPGKEIIFSSKVNGIEGYISIFTSRLEDESGSRAVILEERNDGQNFIRIIYNEDPYVRRDYYEVD